METKNRLISSFVSSELGRVNEYAFYQLNALLKQFCSLYNEASDKPVNLRYRALASLGFPASDIAGGAWLEEPNEDFIELTVSFMGLYGPASPLPAYYTERVLQSSDPQHPSRDLMDLFNHRLISLLQTCWEKYRYYIQYSVDGGDHYSRWLLSMAGVDQALLKESGRLKWHRLLPFSGVLANGSASADAMAKVLSSYFSIPEVVFEPWVIRTIEVPESQCNAMGMKNARLGEDLFIGDSIQDCNGKFNLHLKGLGSQLYRHFLPGGEQFDELVDLLQFLMVDPLEYELWLHPVPAGHKVARQVGAPRELGWDYVLGDDDFSDIEPVRICVSDHRSI